MRWALLVLLALLGLAVALDDATAAAGPTNVSEPWSFAMPAEAPACHAERGPQDRVPHRCLEVVVARALGHRFAPRRTGVSTLFTLALVESWQVAPARPPPAVAAFAVRAQRGGPFKRMFATTTAMLN